MVLHGLPCGKRELVMFLENKQFAEYFEFAIGEKPIVTFHRPARRDRVPIDGIKATLLRFVFSQLTSLHEAFWTMGYDEMAVNAEKKGWRIWEYPESTTESFTFLFHELAVGFQNQIPQLSDKTRVIKTDNCDRSLHLPISMAERYTKYGAGLGDMPAEVSVIPDHRVVEFQQFMLIDRSVQSDVWQMDDGKRYYFNAGYDPVSDRLYIHYDGN